MNLQGTEGWLQDRCGHVTASEFASVLAKGQGKMRAAYMRRILVERLTGKPCETYHNFDMERGLIQEPYARLAYQAETGNLVEVVGFIKHQTLMAGCSPDGLIDEDGGAEIKSVIPTVQVETIIAGGYPNEHRAQVQGSLWITGRRWWDFCSFCPDLPERLRLYIFRVARDEAYIKTLEAEVRGFLLEVQTRYDVLMGNDLKVMAA